MTYFSNLFFLVWTSTFYNFISLFIWSNTNFPWWNGAVPFWSATKRAKIGFGLQWRGSFGLSMRLGKVQSVGSLTLLYFNNVYLQNERKRVLRSCMLDLQYSMKKNWTVSSLNTVNELYIATSSAPHKKDEN